MSNAERRLDPMKMYELGVEAYNLDSLAVCVRDAIAEGDWDKSAYIGGLDVLCEKAHEVSQRVDDLIGYNERS